MLHFHKAVVQFYKNNLFSIRSPDEISRRLGPNVLLKLQRITFFLEVWSYSIKQIPQKILDFPFKYIDSKQYLVLKVGVYSLNIKPGSFPSIFISAKRSQVVFARDFLFLWVDVVIQVKVRHEHEQSVLLRPCRGFVSSRCLFT